jgi:hypothetical protein
VNLRTSGRFCAPMTDLGQKFAQRMHPPRKVEEFFRDRVDAEPRRSTRSPRADARSP